jgi:hypothetical protein
MAGITITVSAVTREAVANLAAFVNQTGSGLKVIEQQARQASNATNQQVQSFVNGMRRGFGSLTPILQSFSGSLAALVSVGGFALLTRTSINLADSLGKSARAAGVTTEQFSGLAFAAERSDVGMEGMRTSLKGFTEYLVKTGQGSANLREALLEQARIFSEMPDGAAKTSLALERFGRAGIQMLPLLNEGEAGMRRLMDRGVQLLGVNDALAKSADEFNDSLTDLEFAAKGLALAIAAETMPRLTEFINLLTSGVVNLRDWIKQSDALRVALEALAVTLGILAARKAALLGTTAFSAIIGAGAITSARDYAAAIALIPTAARSAVAALAPLAVAVTGITTLFEGFKAVQATKGAIESIDSLNARNIQLAESIRAVIKARQEAGALTAEETVKMGDSVALAQSQPPLQASKDLGAIAAKLRQLKQDDGNPIWTREELDLQNKLLAVDIEREQIMRVKSQMTYREKDVVQFLTVQNQNLAKMEELSAQKRINAFQAKEQGAISALEYDQIDLEVQKELLAIDLARTEIKDEEYRRGVDSINNDFSMTEAEKFRAHSDIARNPAELPVGPDPDSWAQQWADALARTRDAMGTWAQFVTKGAFSLVTQATNGLADALTGIVMGTKSAGQAFAQFGAQMLTSFINMIATAVIQAYVAIPILTALGVLTGGATAAAGSAATMTAMSTAVGGVMSMVGGAREAGGSVEPGLMYLVGERGPELMVSGSRGTVIPARQTADMLSRGAAAGAGAGASRTLNQNLHMHLDRRELLRALKEDVRAIALDVFGQNKVQLGLET